jgi:hypothetical protein
MGGSDVLSRHRLGPAAFRKVNGRRDASAGRSASVTLREIGGSGFFPAVEDRLAVFQTGELDTVPMMQEVLDVAARHHRRFCSRSLLPTSPRIRHQDVLRTLLANEKNAFSFWLNSPRVGSAQQLRAAEHGAFIWHPQPYYK